MPLTKLYLIHYVLFLASHVLSNKESSQPLGTDTEIICSPVNSTDCYPQLFRPTVDFQRIREGQDIPPGLHVRMNIQTGEKEARLNVHGPEDNTATSDLQMLKTEKAVIELEQAPEQLDKESSHQKVFQSEKTIKQQVPENKIPPPTSHTELQAFQESIAILKDGGSMFDQALENLSELTHDIFYGREIARENSILELLICLTLGQELKNIPTAQINRERKAASILSSAFQNNPAALKEASSDKRTLIYPSCSAQISKEIRENEHFVSLFRGRLEHENDAPTLKTKIITISRLLKDSSFRDSFLENKGMELLLAIFLKRGGNFDLVRKKVGELLMDNFLDDSFGAQLHIWPKTHTSPQKFCQKDQNKFHDGCWEYHIKKFSLQSPSEDWPKKLLLTLKNRRPNIYTVKSEL